MDDYQRMRDVGGVRGDRLPAGRSLSPAELSALFAACADRTATGARNAAPFALLAAAGLRRAEAVSAAFSDLDTVLWELRVVGKGDREREVPLRGGGRRAVADWLGRRGRLPGPLVCAVSAGDAPVADFPLPPAAVRRRLRIRAAAARIPPCSPHDLRRTFVTRLLDRGVDYNLVRLLAGHRSLQTTTRYDRRPAAAAAAAVELLDIRYSAVR